MVKITLVQNKFWKSSDPGTIKLSENIGRGGRSTDLNKYSSISSPWLFLFHSLEFERPVKLTATEYAAKGFSSWGHYVAMLFCQLGQTHSLRQICNGLAGCFGKLRHLGIARGPKRSALAYANEHRSWELFQKVFFALLERSIGGWWIIDRVLGWFAERALAFDLEDEGIGTGLGLRRLDRQTVLVHLPTQGMAIT